MSLCHSANFTHCTSTRPGGQDKRFQQLPMAMPNQHACQQLRDGLQMSYLGATLNPKSGSVH
jgi:hypothetical protein